MDLVTNAPSCVRSRKSAYSSAYPQVPLAVINGLASLTPAISTARSTSCLATCLPLLPAQGRDSGGDLVRGNVVVNVDRTEGRRIGQPHLFHTDGGVDNCRLRSATHRRQPIGSILRWTRTDVECSARCSAR